METFEHLSPFMLKARILEVGRDRLYQVRKKLLFLLVTEDISDNSLEQFLRDFDCPVFKALTSQALERLFGYHGTKAIGFRRNTLSLQAMAALKERRVRQTKPIPEHPRVAVLGASGIGRHHANWWTMEGADVVAFLGSTPESTAATTALLQGLFAFHGTGYTDLETLLAEARPDIVDVCLPPQLHYPACQRALAAGCHVLCEKPFVYDDTLPDGTLREHGAELQRLALAKGLRLGVCTQYVMAAKEIIRLWQERHPGETITRFDGNLVSPTRNRPPRPEWTWVDLAPHMLGVAQVITKGGTLQESTLAKNFQGHLAEADFDCINRDGNSVHCHIRTFHTDEPPMNVRQIALNGALYDIGGAKDENGVFQMVINTPEGPVDRPDMLRLLIRSFLNGKVEVTPRMANQNLDWLLTVISHP